MAFGKKTNHDIPIIKYCEKDKGETKEGGLTGFIIPPKANLT